MLINEIISIKESYFTDLIVAIQDLLVKEKIAGNEEVEMEDFRSKLSQAGFDSTIDEIIDGIDKTQMASQVNSTSITIKPNLPPEMMGGDEESGTDVGAMAQDQATADVAAELPA